MRTNHFKSGTPKVANSSFDSVSIYLHCEMLGTCNILIFFWHDKWLFSKKTWSFVNRAIEYKALQINVLESSLFKRCLMQDKLCRTKEFCVGNFYDIPRHLLYCTCM